MPPNIILYIADGVGYNHLSCYGGEKFDTPHLDALAASGMMLTDCHSNGCMCSPSRAALETGRYQQRCGMEYVLGPDPTGRPGMPRDEHTFAHSFKQAGYATGMFGMYHTGRIPHETPRDRGFDIYRGVNGGMDHHSRIDRWGNPNWYHDEQIVEDDPGYSTDLIADHALRFIEDNQRNPFVCYIADWLVHFPFQGPNDPVQFHKGQNSDTPEKKYGQVPDKQRAYREMIQAMDASVGRVVEQVRALGLSEQTFIFFSTDHGAQPQISDNHPLNGAKGSMLEGGHRVPAIACWPRHIEPGTRCDQTMMLSDLFPTMLDVASLSPPADRHLDGVSLLPTLTDGEQLPQRLLYWRQGEEWAVRDGPWKLHCVAGESRLFNLDDDLSETTDLSSQQPQRVVELRAAFENWCADVDPEGDACLARMGWAGDATV